MSADHEHEHDDGDSEGEGSDDDDVRDFSGSLLVTRLRQVQVSMQFQQRPHHSALACVAPTSTLESARA